MFCWNQQYYEGDYAEGRIYCTECGEPFNHKAETSEGGTYSHRCGNWIELWPGKFSHCALPVHTGECIGEVVTLKPGKTNYQKPEKEPVRVYTDGGYRNEIGGWGWYEPISKRREFGSAYPTTNQRMELTAAFEAIDSFLDEPNLTIVSDSAYLINNMNEKWYERWQRNGWQTGKGQPIANKDLWEKIIQAVKDQGGTVKFEKVKGHSGDPGNEEADKLATRGILDYILSQRQIDELREMLHAHSYIYYELNDCIISDSDWDSMAMRLVSLQTTYPHSKQRGYEWEYFQDFTGGTGFDMPWTDHIKALASKMVARQRALEDVEQEAARRTGAQLVEDELERRKARK